MADAKLLLVHGGWAGSWIWEPVREPLRQRGVEAEAIERLPSVGRDPSEQADLRGDADHVRSRIDRIGAPVVRCGHSYGGMVITELADHPAVVHSIYLAALRRRVGSRHSTSSAASHQSGSCRAGTAAAAWPTIWSWSVWRCSRTSTRAGG